VRMRPDWSMRCHPVAYRFAYRAQDNDPDQAAEFDAFISNCAPGMVLFDVGAHFGLFSLAALRYGGAEAKALAVDPSPTACRITKIQAGLNNVADRLRVVQASAGDSVGWRDMVAVGVLAGGYFVAPTEAHPARELTRTREVTLDHLAEEFKAMPTHVKIDVEGHEAAVIRGGRQVLSQPASPMLFIELHNTMIRERGDDPRESLSLLEDLGYKTFAVDGAAIAEGDILKRDLIRVIATKLNA
jgi:FkbM family methyltransferase